MNGINLQQILQFLSNIPFEVLVGKTTVVLKNPPNWVVSNLISNLVDGQAGGAVQTYDIRYVDGDFCLSFELKPMQLPGGEEGGGEVPTDLPEGPVQLE